MNFRDLDERALWLKFLEMGMLTEVPISINGQRCSAVAWADSMLEQVRSRDKNRQEGTFDGD